LIVTHRFADETLLQALDKWQSWARDKVYCDYAFHMAITHWDEEKQSAEVEADSEKKAAPTGTCSKLAAAHMNRIRHLDDISLS